MATQLNTSKEPGVVKGFMQRVASVVDRMQLSGLLGTSFNGQRDLYATFGWDRQISPTNVWSMYNRGGIAARVVDAFPEAIWARPPQLYIKDAPEWNAAWDTFATDFSLWETCHRLDVMSCLGRYACLLIGTDRGALDKPIQMRSKITYMQPYAEKDIRVRSYDTNPSSPRFGRPETYTVYPPKNERVLSGVDSVAPSRTSFVVHWSHILHVVRNPLENEDFGAPIYATIWNYLTDLMKVVGSSSESYWLQAFPGLHVDVDKEMDLDAADEANLSAEIDEYMHSFRRYIRTRGVDVNAIGKGIADPAPSFNVLMTLISGTTGIPKRILLGSEAGQLASTQDKGSWAERIEERRSTYCQPRIIIALVRRMHEFGILETDINALKVLWPEAYRMSPLERGQQSAQIARTLANIQKGLQPIQLTPATPDIVAPDGTITAGTPGETAEPLLTRDEARRLLGLSTDQNLVNESPE